MASFAMSTSVSSSSSQSDDSPNSEIEDDVILVGKKRPCADDAESPSIPKKPLTSEKLRQGAILSRGASYQVERHRSRNHPSLSTKEMDLKIVATDHIAVPKGVRELAVKGAQKVELPNTKKDLSEKPKNVNMSEDNNEKDPINNTDQETLTTQRKEVTLKNKVPISTGATLQKDIGSFVTITKQTFEEKMLNLVEKLSHKVDHLSKVSNSQATANISSICSTSSKEMRDAYDNMKTWKKVSNIVELVNGIEHLELYPLTSTDKDEFLEGSGAILRCEICFSLHKDRAGRLTPAKAAKKLSVDCKSICTGRFINPEKMESFMKGTGEDWRKLKSNILQHMICAADGQTHFKALSALSEERNLKRKHYDSAETLVKSALTAIKAKSAAMHYEDQIAFAFSVGAHVGQSGHSRKLVPELVKSLLVAVQAKAKEVMQKCLQSTGLPPHYYLAVDKATVNKRSNQAVIVCPIIDGDRIPIVVAAPEVYKATDDGNIQGGKLDDSASQALNIIEEKLGTTALNYLVGRSILESTAKELDVKATVAATYSQTRFASSAFVQWQRLVKSFKLFAKSLEKASSSVTDELNPLRYQVLGQDFIVDLLMMHDIFTPVAEVMTKLQSISLPPWKAHPYVQKLIKWLEDASTKCSEYGDMIFFPKMKENKKNILDRDPASDDPSERPHYEGVELVVGWKVVGTEVVQQPDVEGKKTPKKQVLTNWEERGPSDSFNDVQQFAVDLAASIQNRVSSCIDDGVGLSNFFDIEEIFLHLLEKLLPISECGSGKENWRSSGLKDLKTFSKKSAVSGI
eukprot:gene1913-2171_t